MYLKVVCNFENRSLKPLASHIKGTMTAIREYLKFLMRDLRDPLPRGQFVRIRYPDVCGMMGVKVDSPVVTLEDLTDNCFSKCIRDMVQSVIEKDFTPVILVKLPDVECYEVSRSRDYVKRLGNIWDFHTWFEFEKENRRKCMKDWDVDLDIIREDPERHGEHVGAEARWSGRTKNHIEHITNAAFKFYAACIRKSPYGTELYYLIEAMYKARYEFGHYLKVENFMPPEVRLLCFEDMEAERANYTKLFLSVLPKIKVRFIEHFLTTYFTEVWNFHRYEFPMHFKRHDKKSPSRYKDFRKWCAEFEE